MTVYVVGYQTAYEGGDTQAVYSTRELAEASWEMRNQSPYGSYEITEFELDLDPNANEVDIDRRPKEGPKTFEQYTLSEMFSRLSLENLQAESPFLKKMNLPIHSGSTVQFFSYAIPENGQTK